MFDDIGPVASADTGVAHGANLADTKYAVQWNTADHDIASTKFAKAKWSARFEASLIGKTAVAATHKRPPLHGPASAGETEEHARLRANLDNIIELKKGALTTKLNGALLKGSSNILDGTLPGDLGNVGFKLNLETKALEGKLSASMEKGLDFDLSLMTISAVLESENIAKMFLDPAIADHVQVKASLRLELSLGPELAKAMAEAINAAADVKKAADFEAKLAATERRLADLAKRSHPKAVLDALDPETRMLNQGAEAERRALEKELRQLQGMKGRMANLRDKATKALQRAGKALSKLPGGKLVGKVAGKALGLVFKKLLPIYNVISTVSDLVDAAELLATLDWGKVGDRIMNGGDGGTVPNPGAAKEGEPGIGGNDSDTSGSDDNADPDAGEYATAADFEATLDAAERPQLEPKAKQILDVLDTRSGGEALSNEEKQTLNSVVPADLDETELEMIRATLMVAGNDRQDTVTAVIAAIQSVRPFGQKLTHEPPDAASASHAHAADHAADRPTPTQKRKPTQPKPEPSEQAGQRSSTVDPIPALRAAITWKDGQPFAPIGQVEFDGVVVEVQRVQAAQLLTVSDEGPLDLLVTMTVLRARPGAILTDGTALYRRVELSVRLSMTPPRPGPRSFSVAAPTQEPK